MPSKFQDYETPELERLLAEYQEGNERGQFTWKIQEIEAELHFRTDAVTIAMDRYEKQLIVRSPENRIGEVVLIDWDAGAIR